MTQNLAMTQDLAMTGALAKPAVIEIVRFRLAPGVTREAFVAAAAATMPLLRQCRGFIGRSLSEGADGGWVDHLAWESRDLAEAAMAVSMEAATFRPFVASIDPASMELAYQTVVALD